MVALAPNTSETSSWDVLSTFPKLHSRAREVKTRICTEATHSKSLGRVEIWLVISESCVGLESFTRDPIGFDGSEWGLYEFSNSRSLTMVDPSGTVCQQPCVPRDKTTCCADAFKLAVNGGMQGRAFCCDGGMVACVWGQNLPGVNPAAKSLMEKCVQQHEDQHVRDSGPCPKGCPRLDFISYSSGYTDAMSECLAIKLMLRCLIAARRQCAQTPGCDPAEITFYINRDVLPRGKKACRMAGMVEP